MCRISGNRHPVVITLLFSVYMADCTNVKAKIGTTVVLPCSCSNTSSLISWQRGETIVYTEDRNLMSPQYCNRSGIQQNSCSLILSQVNALDDGEYTCYYDGPSFSFVHVNLQVTDFDTYTQSAYKSSRNVSVVSVVCVLLIILLIILFVWIIKWRSRTQETRENQCSRENQEDTTEEHDLCI